MALHILLSAAVARAAPTAGVNGPQLAFIDTSGQVALLWTSIGLAVITSFWQGLIVTIVTIAEDQGMWTFRFRIARYEHWWWTVVSIMLACSFVLIVFSFLAGNSSDSLGVLTLSTATAISIVRYAIPAWRNRSYIELRWLSWTGPSRTGIPSSQGRFCSTEANWRRIQRYSREAPVILTPSDEWGWAIKRPNKIPQDPTTLLQGLEEAILKDESSLLKDEIEASELFGPCVYNDGYEGSQVSLLWGESEGFQRRVSRAINSMPSSLLKSVPSTYDGFNGTGLCLAMGILGRNKGLKPFELVYDFQDRRKAARGITRSHPNVKVTNELETTSSWFPRPNKVMRSFYQKSMEEQYSGLGPEYVAVAVELALVLLDCPHQVIMHWLNDKLEQQSMEINAFLSNRSKESISASSRALQTLYRASYTSMILSLNYYRVDAQSNARRPDLTCFALLWLAEEASVPDWWSRGWVRDRLAAEWACLEKNGKWKRAASWLLGLPDVPVILDLSKWPAWPIEKTAS